MNTPSGLAAKLRALLKSKQSPLWGMIIILLIIVIWQQIQLSELQYRVDEDHDGSTMKSVAGRLYILEGMANKHSEDITDLKKAVRNLQNEGAEYDWSIKQLQWLHPELSVTPTGADAQPLTSPDITVDTNPGKVPDVR